MQALGDLDVALVLTTFDGPASESLGRGRKMQSAAGRPLEAAVPAVDISIIDKGSLSAQEVQVNTPIYVRISREAPDPTWICAYLDGDTWSTEGVRLATPGELEAAFGAVADTSGVWCVVLPGCAFVAAVPTLHVT